jgi:defect-in-organelle-trafficking protein DotC
MLQQFKWVSCVTICALFLTGCDPVIIPPKPLNHPVDTTNLAELENLNQEVVPKNKNEQINPLRLQALKDAALSVGAQGALAKRSEEIDKMLAQDTRYLDQVFNFTPLMLPHNVLPPVILEGDRPLNLADSNTIRLADKTFTIAQQAKFVTVPPTWHDYLWMSFPKPNEPDNSLLPKSPKEQDVWKKYIKMGWAQGTEQANTIFADNVARLKQQYQGIVLYRKLLNQNMVSLPYVANTELGITGGGDQMSVNDQVLRITALPTLNSDSQYWKATVGQQDQPALPAASEASPDTGIDIK